MSEAANPSPGADTSLTAAVGTGLFSSHVETAKPAPKAAEKPPEEEQPNPEGQPTEEPAPEETATEGEQPEVQEPDEQTEQEAAPSAIDLTKEGDREITVTVNGEAKTLKLSEAVKGVQLEQDYRRKTSELSEQRKALEGERVALGTERQQHADTLRQISLKVQQAAVGTPPDIEMLNPASPKYAPDQYHLDKARFEQRARDYTATLQQLDAIEQEEAGKRSQHVKAQREYNRQKLIEAIPEYGDPEKARKIVGEIATSLRSYGFTDKEIAAIGDHRMARLLTDFVRGKATKASIEQKKVAPKPGPTVKPGAATAPAQAKQGKVTAARAQLAKDKSIRSAATVFSLTS